MSSAFHISETSFHEIENRSTFKDLSSTEDELPKVFNNKRSKTPNTSSNAIQCSKVLFPPEKETPLTRGYLIKQCNMVANLDLKTQISDSTVIELLDSPEDESGNEKVVLKEKLPTQNTKPETVLIVESPVRGTFIPNTNSNPIVIQDTPPVELPSFPNAKQSNKDLHNKKLFKKEKKKQVTTSKESFGPVDIKNAELQKDQLNNFKATVKLKKLNPDQIALRTSSRDRKQKTFSDEYVLPKKRGTKNVSMNKSKSDSAILELNNNYNDDNKKFSLINSNQLCDLTKQQNDPIDTNSISDDPIAMLPILKRIPDIEFMRFTRSREKSSPTSSQHLLLNCSPQQKVGNEPFLIQKQMTLDKEDQKPSAVNNFTIKIQYKIWQPIPLHSQLVSVLVL